MSDETRNPQDEAENERRPSHLAGDETEVEGHRVFRRSETGEDDAENERRPSHLTDDDDAEVEGHMRPRH